MKRPLTDRDRFGLTQAIGGLVLGLIALFRSATTPPPQHQRRLDPQGFARLHRAATGPAYFYSPLFGKQQPAHLENVPNE